MFLKSFLSTASHFPCLLVKDRFLHQKNKKQKLIFFINFDFSIAWNLMSIIDSWSRNDWSLMAVSLSTNAVKLYSPATGQYSGECKGHSSTINQISFSGPSTPHVLHSCSSDGTIRAWDTRSFHEVLCAHIYAVLIFYLFCASFLFYFPPCFLVFFFLIYYKSCRYGV